MAVWTYDESLRRLLVHEGGYSNHPSDPGGPTKYGITIADYRRYVKPGATAEDVKNMPLSDAKSIYKHKYWDRMRCDDLPPGVDYTIFDYGVNSGTGRAPKVLKRCLGLDASDSTVTDKVIEAAKKRDPKALAKGICDERLRFLQSLRTWPTFGAGWGRRVKECLAAALAMITRGAPVPAKPQASAKPQDSAAPPPVSPSIVGKATVPEPTIAKEVIRTGGGGAGAAAAYTWWDWVVAHPMISVVIAAAIIALIGFCLYQLKRWHTNKQETPMLNTPVVPEAK